MSFSVSVSVSDVRYLFTPPSVRSTVRRRKSDLKARNGQMTLQERLKEKEGEERGEEEGAGGHARDYIDDRDETERAPRPEPRQHDAKREKE